MTRVQKQGSWLIARIGNEAVLMNRQKVQHIAVSEVGGRIWELMDLIGDVEGICARLREEYDIRAEACRTEVVSFLREMANQEAVRLDPANP